MKGCTQDQEFDDNRQAGKLPVDLTVAQGLSANQCQTADKGQYQVQGRRALNLNQQVGGKEDGRTYLVQSPDKNRDVQDPIGAIANSSHWALCVPGGLRFLGHGFFLWGEEDKWCLIQAT